MNQIPRKKTPKLKKLRLSKTSGRTLDDTPCTLSDCLESVPLPIEAILPTSAIVVLFDSCQSLSPHCRKSAVGGRSKTMSNSREEEPVKFRVVMASDASNIEVRIMHTIDEVSGPPFFGASFSLFILR